MPRKHFPRLLRGEVADLLKDLLWQNPVFSASIAKKRDAVVLRFRVPIHDAFRTQHPALFDLVFGSQAKVFLECISTAYRHVKWGDRTVSYAVSTALHCVYRHAIDAWYRYTLELITDPACQEKNQADSNPGAPLKRSQPDPYISLLIADRRQELKPAIKTLQRLAKTKPFANSKSLKEYMRSFVPSAIAPEKVLERLYKGQDNSVNISSFPVGAILDTYIQLEIEKLIGNRKKNQVSAYIRTARRIRTTLSQPTITP